MRRSRRRAVAFTLSEILVVVGIVAVLIGLLVPVVSRVRSSAVTAKCLSNLRQLGMASVMYAEANKDFLPDPTTTVHESLVWFNALDPYLNGRETDKSRSGVARTRNYKAWKQCSVYDSFPGGQGKGAQDALTEAARTYKMNTHLRHPDGKQASLGEIPRPAEFVFIGDGLSLDLVGEIPDNYENKEFSMEVNDVTRASPGLRHNGGANILFVDGHAGTFHFKTVTKHLRGVSKGITVRTWESEYVDGSGAPVEPKDYAKTMAAQGLKRNPEMPLVWSELGRIYRKVE